MPNSGTPKPADKPLSSATGDGAPATPLVCEKACPAFLRPKGDRADARVFTRNEGDEEDSPPPRDQWNDLGHGDLLYRAGGYRGNDTWIVAVDSWGGKSVSVSTDPAGYCEIGTDISRQIEDPLDFYGDATDAVLYYGVASIQFDPERHEKVLRTCGACGASGAMDGPFSVMWSTCEGFEVWHRPEGGYAPE